MTWALLADLAKRYWWAALAILAFALGWWARSASVSTVDAHTKVLMDSLDATREAYFESTTARRNLIERLRIADSARIEALRKADAAVYGFRAAEEELKTQSAGLKVALRAAKTAADSVPLLVQQVSTLESALDRADSTIGSLTNARTIAQARIESLEQTKLALTAQRVEDSTRIVLQEAVIKGLDRAKSPCTKWCPTGLLTYEVSNKAVSAGVGIRPRSWITVGAEYRIGG